MGQTPDDFANAELPLGKQHDAGVRWSILIQPLPVQWNEVADIVRHKHAPAGSRLAQLRFVVHPLQTGRIGRHGCDGVLPKGGGQRGRLAILIELEL